MFQKSPLTIARGMHRARAAMICWFLSDLQLLSRVSWPSQFRLHCLRSKNGDLVTDIFAVIFDLQSTGNAPIPDSRTLRLCKRFILYINGTYQGQQWTLRENQDANAGFLYILGLVSDYVAQSRLFRKPKSPTREQLNSDRIMRETEQWIHNQL